MPDLIPWGAKEISKLKDDVDRLFEALFEDFGLAGTAFPEGTVRVIEADGEWVVTCPLPGVEPEDVAVTVTGRTLSIEAARKQGPGGGLVRLARELTLPFHIDAAQADFEGGILTVRLARQAPPAVRAIPVIRRKALIKCSPGGAEQADKAGTGRGCE